MAVLVVGLASVARADSTGNDPVMKLGPSGHSTVLNGDTFTLHYTEGFFNPGVINFDFINNTGKTVDAINLVITGSSGLTFSCNNTGDPYFDSCSPTQSTSGPLTISFFGVDATHPGIPSASSVFCDDDDDDEGSVCSSSPALSDFSFIVNVAGMTRGQSFSAAGTLVPAAEPATIVLLVAGALAFALWKRVSVTTI